MEKRTSSSAFICEGMQFQQNVHHKERKYKDLCWFFFALQYRRIIHFRKGIKIFFASGEGRAYPPRILENGFN